MNPGLAAHTAVPPQAAIPPRSSSLLATPPAMLAIVLAWIFFGELGEMLLLAQLPPLPVHLLAVVDALVLLLLLSPTYWLFYRPLVRLNEERLQSAREMRQLSRRLLQAAEEEKKRLAGDLHDECGQTLTALQFLVETLKTTLPPEADKSLPQVERIGELVAQLSREIRSLAVDLRPAGLDELGLEPALRWHVKRFARLLPGLDLRFESRGCIRRLAPEAELALFRCCQEGLNNIAKHSRAQRASITLECTGAKVLLIIADDGCGFDLQAHRRSTDQAAGVGLPGMRERMQALSGWLTIVTRPGQGTQLFLTLPQQGSPS